MPSWTYLKAPTWFATAVATLQGWCHPVTNEILVAIRQLTDKIDTGFDNFELEDGSNILLEDAAEERSYFLLLED
jgi:hypothetical protein